MSVFGVPPLFLTKEIFPQTVQHELLSTFITPGVLENNGWLACKCSKEEEILLSHPWTLWLHRCREQKRSDHTYKSWHNTYTYFYWNNTRWDWWWRRLCSFDWWLGDYRVDLLIAGCSHYAHWPPKSQYDPSFRNQYTWRTSYFAGPGPRLLLGPTGRPALPTVPKGLSSPPPMLRFGSLGLICFFKPPGLLCWGTWGLLLAPEPGGLLCPKLKK